MTKTLPKVVEALGVIPLVSLTAAATALGVTPKSLRDWINAGEPTIKIKAVRVGRRWKIPFDELERLLNEGTTTPAA